MNSLSSLYVDCIISYGYSRSRPVFSASGPRPSITGLPRGVCHLIVRFIIAPIFTNQSGDESVKGAKAGELSFTSAIYARNVATRSAICCRFELPVCCHEPLMLGALLSVVVVMPRAPFHYRRASVINAEI